MKVHLSQVYKQKQNQVSETFKYGDLNLNIDWAKLKEAYMPGGIAWLPGGIAWLPGGIAWLEDLKKQDLAL